MGLESVYSAFTGGKGDMDSRTFAKLCKETGLVDKKKFTTTDCDLVFTKVKVKGGQRLGFSQFEDAMKEVAKKKGMTYEEVVAKVGASEGPVFTGTKTEDVRFYDDKSTFTGVHAHGGPSTVDKPNTKFNSTFSNPAGNEGTGGGSAITLDQMCDRSAPDARGVNKNFKK